MNKKLTDTEKKKLIEILLVKNITELQLQMVFRAISDWDRQKLCKQILSGFENKTTHTTKNIWKLEYKLLYPH